MSGSGNTLDRIFREADSFRAYGRRYLDYCAALMARVDLDALEPLVKILEQARRSGKTVFLAGNGGSAATASHLVNDLTLGTHVPGEPPLRAASLGDNLPSLTALGNDQRYEHIFSGQLEKMLTPKDVLVVISASGNSANLVHAVEYANAHDAVTVGLLGFDGGRLKALCRHALVIETPGGDYGPVEDLHIVIGHLVTTYLVRRLQAGAARRADASGIHG